MEPREETDKVMKQARQIYRKENNAHKALGKFIHFQNPTYEIISNEHCATAPVTFWLVYNFKKQCCGSLNVSF
jgi:hypothetical protein